MIKTATQIAPNYVSTATQSSGAAMHDKPSDTTSSSSDRFPPPIENALKAIVSNRRLIQAQRDD